MRLLFCLLLVLSASAAQAQYTPRQLVDAVPGIGSGSPYAFTPFDGTLYFTAQDATINGTDLWRYDPAAGTTTKVLDMRTGGFSSTVLFVFNNRLFLVYRPTSSSIRIGEYRPASNTLVAASNAVASTFMAFHEAAVGGKVYLTSDNAFFAFDPSAQTLALAYPHSASTPTSLSPPVAFNGKVYVSGSTAAQGRELWAFDPATGQIALAVDHTPGTASSTMGHPVVIGRHLVVGADQPTGNVHTLWALNAGATSLTALTPAGTAPFAVGFPTEMNGKIYFTGVRSDVGSELWVYDPATATTALAADVVPGTDGSSIAAPVVFDGNLFFQATTPTERNELWRFDGTTAQIVADLAPGGGNGVGIGLLNPAVVFHHRLFFQGYDGVTGYEPWYVEGRPVANEDEPLPGVSAFSLAPNPARGTATVTLALDAPQTAAVAVHDVLGRDVARLHQGPLAAGVHRLPVPALAPGVYLVRVAVGGAVRTERLTVAR